jgi:PII-like signaling protein
MIGAGLRLSVWFGEALTAGPHLASEALMAALGRHELACTTLLRGIEGFGLNRRIHAERLPDVSTDLPLVATALGPRETVLGALEDVDAAVPRGLVTLEPTTLATDGDVAGLGAPDGPGDAAKLTLYCRAGARTNGRTAARAAVDVLRRGGAAGAIVLRGVDGAVAGRRGRARLFGANGDVPMTIISVGPPGPLRACLPDLAALVAEPIVTFEAVARVKHDGEPLEPPAVPARVAAERDAWQTIRVYARRTAHVDGHPLYSELTRRLRAAGAAGATTILGDWGFSRDEHPHGDRFGRLASHRPTYTVYIDRPDRVAAVWPLIDEATAEHGLVTSRVVPGYRERAGATEHGALSGA